MSRLEFVQARFPDAVEMKPGGYVVIKPEGRPGEEDDSVNESDASYSSVASETGVGQSSDASFTAGHNGDDPNSSRDAAVSSSDSDSEPEPDSESRSQTVRFYDVNENPKDRGTRNPSHIWKSWQASASAPVGLENRGVTCYINSAVQSLFHLPAFGRYMQQIANGTERFKRGSVSLELALLFRKVTEARKRSHVYPSRLVRRLEDINPMLSEFEQQDSHEFLMSLLGKLQDESVPKGQKLRSSILHDMFGGTLEQKVVCRNCGHVSKTSQDFYDLPVHFNGRKPYTLDRAIRAFFGPEAIKAAGAPAGSGKGGSDDNDASNGGYYCEKCKQLTQATKNCLIEDAPEHLTVHMMRFKFEASCSHKVKDAMTYPLELDLSHYSVNHEPLRYKLIAVIVHEGRTVSSGHYIALCRQPSNDWAMYDDEDMRRVSESLVRKQTSAYILIYSKLTPKPMPKPVPKSAAKPTAKPTVKPTVKPTATIRPPLALPKSQKTAKTSSNSKPSRSSPPKQESRQPGWSRPVDSPQSPQPKQRKRAGEEIDVIFGSKRHKS